MLKPCAFQKIHTTKCNEKNKKICLKMLYDWLLQQRIFFWSFNNLNKKDLIFNSF